MLRWKANKILWSLLINWIIGYLHPSHRVFIMIRRSGPAHHPVYNSGSQTRCQNCFQHVPFRAASLQLPLHNSLCRPVSTFQVPFQAAGKLMKFIWCGPPWIFSYQSIWVVRTWELHAPPCAATGAFTSNGLAAIVRSDFWANHGTEYGNQGTLTNYII